MAQVVTNRSGGGGAPTDGTYLTTTANSTLSAESNLGALSTGVLQIAVSAGVATPSVFVPTANRIPFGSSVTAGHLTSTDNLRFSDSVISLGIGAAPATGVHLHIGADAAQIALDATSNNAQMEWRKAGTMVLRGRTGTTNFVWETGASKIMEYRANGTGYHSFQTAGGEALKIEANGDFTILEASDFVLGTTTGTKIGTATSQKLGLWNATPITQPATTGVASGFTQNAGTEVRDDSTFTGGTGSKAYRISDIVFALKSIGAMAAS